ncbi:MAG: hypothetical protein R3C68_09850 [Myxococcota bacterium]
MTEADERSAIWSPALSLTDGQVIGVPAIGDWCACSQAGELLRIETVFPRHGTMIPATVAESGHAGLPRSSPPTSTWRSL